MDRLIGENLAALRGEMSQKALADAMRDRGHKWSQSTVWAVEKGDRPLKLSESRDLEGVLDVRNPGEWFRREPRMLPVVRAADDLRSAHREAVNAVANFLHARMEVHAALSGAWELLPNERPRLVGWVRNLLGASSEPEWIVEEARGRAAGSPKQVIGGERGDAYPHSDEIAAIIRSEEEALEGFIEEVRGYGVDQEEE